MLRMIAIRRTVLLAVIVPLVAFADAYGDLQKLQAAFHNVKSWHADEHMPNGQTVAVDFVAPDRWRIEPMPNMTELVIGSDVYMVRNGHAMKLPMGGAMVQQMTQNVGFSVQQDVKQSARDLGIETLDGESVHVYSYTTHGIPVTLYVGANSLPVQSVVHDKRGTIRIKYSQYNAPISIKAP